VSIVSGIPGVSILRGPLLLSWRWREQEFGVFELGGDQFLVWEPFGDNSRYWVGPIVAGKWSPHLETVRAAFAGVPRFRWWST
jgi:hypothetical protein